MIRGASRSQYPVKLWDLARSVWPQISAAALSALSPEPLPTPKAR